MPVQAASTRHSFLIPSEHLGIILLCFMSCVQCADGVCVFVYVCVFLYVYVYVHVYVCCS